MTGRAVNPVRGQVTVVGSVNRDTTVQVPRFPVPGETLAGAGTRTGLGGKGANQAVAAARSGARTAWIGAVGADGEDVLAALRSEGIEVAEAVQMSGVATGSAWVMVDPAGENAIVIDPGANAFLRPSHIPSELTGVVLLQHEVSAEVVTCAVEASRRAVTVLNPAPYRSVDPAVLAAVDVVVVNEVELAELTGCRTGSLEDVCDALAALPNPTVIATLGSRGAVLRSQDLVEFVEAPVVAAIDTTGAGDTFCGALAARLAGGGEILEAVRFAVHAAGLSVTRAGAQAAIPHIHHVVEQMELAGAH